MTVRRGRLGKTVAVLAAATLALGAAACSASDDTGEGGEVTVVLQWFGSPGFDTAVKKFEEANPGIKVDSQNMGQLRDYQPHLVQWLATGSPQLGDVIMLEEGTLLEMMQDPSKWANLADLGATDREADYLPYKWNNGWTADKSKLMALGTDIGGLAMCYRTDLFEKAGLPTDREEVSALWPTWDAYKAQGERFLQANTGAVWLDSVTSIMQPYIMQNSDVWFYDRDNNFILETNPVVKEAWDYAFSLADAGLTAKLVRWTPDWDAAFKNAAFATVPCPAWYTGVIEERAGAEASGKWDIADIPGGSGNWGGSYLAIPEQSTKKEAAMKLINFLTSEEGELLSFEEKGTMPSVIPALDNPRFKDKKSEYFSNAPVGEIFGSSVKELKPIYLGPYHQQLWENILEPQMQAVEQGTSTKDAAFAKAVADGKELIS